MKSATAPSPYLLDAYHLVFSNAGGFSRSPNDGGERQSMAQATDSGDRTYWIAYDYYMEARAQRALRRQRIYASAKAFGKALVERFTGQRVRPAYAERIAA